MLKHTLICLSFFIAALLSAASGNVAAASAGGGTPCHDNDANSDGLCADPIFTNYQVGFQNGGMCCGQDVYLGGSPAGVPDTTRRNTVPEFLDYITSNVINWNFGRDSGCVSDPANLTGVYWQWDFQIQENYRSTVSGPTTSGCTSGFYSDIAKYRQWDCPAGYTKKNATILSYSVTPDAVKGHPCFKPIPPSYGSCTAGDPVSILGGIVIETEVDYAGRGNKLQFVRGYRSDGTVGLKNIIGSNWSASFFQSIGAGLVGDGGAIYIRSSGEPQYFKSAGASNWAGPAFDRDRLQSIDSGGTRVGWTYSDQNARSIKSFNSIGALLSEAFAGGGSLSYQYSDATTTPDIAPAPGLLISVTDEFARRLAIKYDSSSQVTSIVDPALQTITYSYVRSPINPIVSDLVQATYQDLTSKKYSYKTSASLIGAIQDFGQAGLLTSIVDELNVPLSSFTYSASQTTFPRQVISQQAGGVNKFTFDLNGGSTNLTDPLGTQRIYISVTIPGAVQPRVLEQEKDIPAGSGCNANTVFTYYDSNGNAASRDSYDGSELRRTCYTNDLSRNLELVRVEGAGYLPGGFDATHDCLNALVDNSVLPAGSRKITTAWHPTWSFPTRKADPGRLTTSIYNGQPDPFNGGAVASCAPSTALLPGGSPIAVLCKVVEQATTDTDGHLGFTAALQAGVSNRVTQWTYNQYGQVLTAKDALNHITSYAYYVDTVFTGTDPNAMGHTLGDLQTITNATGKVLTFTKYDKHGQLLEHKDPNGVVTSNTYDLRQRLLSISTGGQTTAYQYDVAGQLLKITAPDSSWLGYEYDAAHRQTAFKDNIGNRVEYTVDNAGNRTAENIRNVGGTIARQLARSIDALGRVKQTTGRE